MTMRFYPDSSSISSKLLPWKLHLPEACLQQEGRATTPAKQITTWPSAGVRFVQAQPFGPDLTWADGSFSASRPSKELAWPVSCKCRMSSRCLQSQLEASAVTRTASELRSHLRYWSTAEIKVKVEIEFEVEVGLQDYHLPATSLTLLCFTQFTGS